MADALTPESVRTRQFDVTRRGYERAQVDAFLAGVAARIAELEAALEHVDPTDPQLGIDDPELLARELHRVGAEVGAVLEAARAAAEGIRTRAAVDAEVTTGDAAERARMILEEATEQSQAARSSAWKDGTALLRAAQSEAQAMVDTAKEEALFVRAEAEREALRLTGDAKRDRDEAIRSARAEAEAIVDQARTESDAVLTAANQQAELAQERARALEDRRTELLAELEAARASITDMEQEIESKRQELDAPPEPEEPEPERSHHTSDGGSVRIVAPSAVVSVHPVDAEEFVAEVEALRATPTSPEPAVDVPSLPPEAPTSPVAPALVPDEEPTIEGDSIDVGSGVVATEPSVSEPPAESQPDPEPPSEPEPVTEPVTEVAVVEPEEPTASEVVEPVAELTAPDDPIGSLFDQLRSASTDDPVDSPIAEPAASTDTPSESATSDGAGTPTPESSTPDAATDEVSAPDTHAEEPATATDEARDLRARNEALRSIKRSLVELQNETLEHLRTDEAWMPDEAFTDRFGAAFGELTEALTGTRTDDDGAAFGADLFDAVSTAIERARADGAGEREVAAAASKIFRMWRSDEAERRVMGLAPASV